MPRVKKSSTPRTSIKDRPGRWTLLLRRQKGRLRALAFITAAAGVVLGFSALVRASDPGSSLVSLREHMGQVAAVAGLRVRHVVIRGRHNTPAPLLREAIGITPGEPILSFSLSQTRARIESLAWVRSAVVERRLPDTVLIVLTEKRPFALWQHDGQFSVIDRDGDTVTERDVRAFRDLPLVVGPGAPSHAAELFDALQSLPGIGKRVAAAVRVGERRWNLVLKDGTTVELPDDHAAVALTRLAALDAKYALLDRPLAVVDMRLGDRLVLRPWPAPPPSPPGSPESNAAPAAKEKS
ncbi:MAG TPA: cell division protein FtsQ/DivIB [Acetobacteraceae bacterium]|nr:cell division protein FtsQ/DivIB [Acetobacteraceae bacterium]